MGQGGGRHRGVSEKKFSGRLRRPKNFSPAPPPGGENFFSVGGLFSRPGGDFAQKSQKMASPGGQNFFSPGCFAPRGAPPPVFFPPGVGQIFGLRGGCTPPHHSGQGVIKKKIFCLRILISWAQIDPWGLIRRTNTIKSVSETFLLIEILV